MKHVSKITAFAAFLIIAAVPATLAQSTAESMRSYTLPTFTVDGVADPELLSYVTPRVPSYLVGSSLIMYYTISDKGNVHSISSNGVFSQKNLAALMKDALSDWHFEPAINDSGEPVAIKVAMPVKIVANEASSYAYVSIDVKGMKLVSKSS
jgi:hypothetical protein